MITKEFAQKIRDIDSRIDPESLHEQIRASVMRVIKENAPPSLIPWFIQQEIEIDLDIHIQAWLNAHKNDLTDNGHDPYREEEFEALSAKYANEFDAEERDPKVDKIIESKGKLTALHVAVDKGDLAEVIRLVEQENVKTNVKDSYDLTPYDRAKLRGLTEIVKYLSAYDR